MAGITFNLGWTVLMRLNNQWLIGPLTWKRTRVISGYARNGIFGLLAVGQCVITRLSASR